MLVLQIFLDLEILIAARTAPGHSYSNPKNCILNFGLNAMGCMRTDTGLETETLNPGSEKKLSNCSGVDDVRNLLKRNSTEIQSY